MKLCFFILLQKFLLANFGVLDKSHNQTIPLQIVSFNLVKPHKQKKSQLQLNREKIEQNPDGKPRKLRNYCSWTNANGRVNLAVNNLIKMALLSFRTPKALLTKAWLIQRELLFSFNFSSKSCIQISCKWKTRLWTIEWEFYLTAGSFIIF